jgi:hypothetical protein
MEARVALLQNDYVGIRIAINAGKKTTIETSALNSVCLRLENLLLS